MDLDLGFFEGLIDEMLGEIFHGFLYDYYEWMSFCVSFDEADDSCFLLFFWFEVFLVSEFRLVLW